MKGAIGHRVGLHTGYRLPGFGIRRVLGQSGFGITYLAHDFQSGRDAVLNEFFPVELAVRGEDERVQPLSPRHAEVFRDCLRRFVNEGRALTALRHPNLERVRAVLEANDTAFLVAEAEPGRSFEAWLADRDRFDENELQRLLLPLLGALEHAHGAGFVHGNVTPSNIMVRPDGSPVLVDFGTGRRALARHSRAGGALLAPGYAPIELCYGDEDATGPASDLYGLAAVLYRAVTGVPPADAVDREAALSGAGVDPCRSAVEQGRWRYSERFLRALDRALAVAAGDRPASAADWRGALDLPERPGAVAAAPAATTGPALANPAGGHAAGPAAEPGAAGSEAAGPEAAGSEAAGPVPDEPPDPGPRPEIIPSPARLSGRRRLGALAGLMAVFAILVVVLGRVDPVPPGAGLGDGVDPAAEAVPAIEALSPPAAGPAPDARPGGAPGAPTAAPFEAAGDAAVPAAVADDAPPADPVPAVVAGSATPAPPAGAPAAAAPPAAPAEAGPFAAHTAWIRAQDPGGFCLQLFALSRPDTVEKLIGTYPELPLKVHVADGPGPRYRILYGLFESREAAVRAFYELPRSFTDFLRRIGHGGKPVVKSLLDLQDALSAPAASART